jgi:hypothetical protein
VFDLEIRSWGGGRGSGGEGWSSCQETWKKEQQINTIFFTMKMKMHLPHSFASQLVEQAEQEVVDSVQGLLFKLYCLKKESKTKKLYNVTCLYL